MKAAVTSAVGGPIELMDVPEPDRRPGEVLVRVMAASVNRLDRFVYDRGFGMGAPATFPLIQGIDAAGIIEWGSGSLAAGVRVAMKPTIACRACRWCRADRPADCTDSSTFGIHRQGGFAEFVAVPRSNLIALPDGVSFASGAAAAHTHAVVLRMIRAAGELPPDAIVLVTGCGGALGSAAVQLATVLGHRVIATASSDAKLLQARELGAVVGLNRTAGNLIDDVGVSTSGAGVDLAIETTGDPVVIREAYESLGRGGTLVIVGALPGAVIDIDVLGLYRSRRRIVGSANSNLRDFSDVYRLLAEHEIEPVVSETFPLDSISRAMDAVLDRDRIGKVLVDVGGECT